MSEGVLERGREGEVQLIRMILDIEEEEREKRNDMQGEREEIENACGMIEPYLVRVKYEVI